jgi:4-amino-4-deoxy-L-arabinose transferase-like glycosyltransferase
MFLPFLGRVHLFDWDEINFAECAREMIMAKKYFLVTINYLPFWEKPPLFIWMQALSMKAIGVGDYAARLPNAICGIATLLLLFRIGTILKDARFGLLWALAYIGSILPHFYFKSGIIDPWFNFFIFCGIYFFARYRMQQKNLAQGKVGRLLALSALSIGLAIMTKGPVALLVFMLSGAVYWFMEKRKSIIRFGHALIFLLVLTLTGGMWFFAEALTGHWATVVEFIQYQVRLFKTGDSGHGGPVYFHVVILLLGCFPASIFAIRGMMLNRGEDEKFNEMTRWMGILFWIVLILFSIVKTKIIHYSSLCYYPLTFFAALAMYKILFENAPWKKWMSWGLAVTGGLVAIALVALPIAGMNKYAIRDTGIIHDRFAYENLDANVTWTYADCVIGLILLCAIIVSITLIAGKKYRPGILVMFIGTLVTTNTALIFIAPKIEAYSQDAAIEFYQSLAGKDVYVVTLGYKSFAQYFYSNEQPWQNPQCTDTEWLLHGKIDKPAYFVCKITQVDDVKRWCGELKEISRKNGFVFMERVNTAR